MKIVYLSLGIAIGTLSIALYSKMISAIQFISEHWCFFLFKIS
jgi:hypothetical protein